MIAATSIEATVEKIPIKKVFVDKSPFRLLVRRVRGGHFE